MGGCFNSISTAAAPQAAAQQHAQGGGGVTREASGM